MHHRAETYTHRELLVIDRICADIDVVHQRRLAIPMKPLRAEPRHASRQGACARASAFDAAGDRSLSREGPCAVRPHVRIESLEKDSEPAPANTRTICSQFVSGEISKIRTLEAGKITIR
jgi:hypothetical protein